MFTLYNIGRSGISVGCKRIISLQILFSIHSMTLALGWPPGGPSPTPMRPTSACYPHNIVSGHVWEEFREGKGI